MTACETSDIIPRFTTKLRDIKQQTALFGYTPIFYPPEKAAYITKIITNGDMIHKGIEQTNIRVR